MTKRTHADTSREAALRDWNKFLGLWRVCETSACRRGGACRGNVRACMPRNFALVPDGVQGWFINLVVAKEVDLSFDDALARIAGTEIEEAFHLWHAGDEAAARNVYKL